MNENDSISHIKEDDLGKRFICASDIIRVATEYLGKNYSGIFNISSNIESNEYIKIMEYYLIKLFKYIVDASELKSLINVNISCNSTDFRIDICYSSNEAFDNKFQREMIRLGKLSGLDAFIPEHGIFFIKKIFKPTSIAVFTNPVTKMQLEKLFRDVFENRI